MNDLKERLEQCFQTVFPDLDDDQIAGSSLDIMAGWDSLASITLLAVIEEDLEVGFVPEDFAKLTSFELILNLLKEKTS